MKNMLVLLADGFEEIEAFTIVDVLRRANVNCDICSITDNDIVSGAQGIKTKVDIILDNIEDNYDGVVLPGGDEGARRLKESIKVETLLKEYNESGKLIGAICAAPEVLMNAGIVGDKKITSYPNILKDYKCNYTENIVEVSGNMITSRGPATTLEFSYELLSMLGLNKKAEELREGMLYNYFKNNIK